MDSKELDGDGHRGRADAKNASLLLGGKKGELVPGGHNWTIDAEIAGVE